MRAAGAHSSTGGPCCVEGSAEQSRTRHHRGGTRGVALPCGVTLKPIAEDTVRNRDDVGSSCRIGGARGSRATTEPVTSMSIFNRWRSSGPTVIFSARWDRSSRPGQNPTGRSLRRGWRGGRSEGYAQVGLSSENLSIEVLACIASRR